MVRAKEAEKQLWDAEIAARKRTISDHESEIARIRTLWTSEPRYEQFSSRIAHLESEIAAERACLGAALEQRQDVSIS